MGAQRLARRSRADIKRSELLNFSEFVIFIGCRFQATVEGPVLSVNMKSAFGSKRKARKIQVDEDDDEGGATDGQGSVESLSTSKSPGATTMSAADREKLADEIFIATAGPSNQARKAFKKSSLRQSVAFDDEADDNVTNVVGSGGDESQNSNKATIGRSNSLLKKKKATSSRLSFGPGEIISGDAAEALEDDEAFTPRKPTLGRRVIESNALRKSLPYQGLPVDEEQRPTYNKDYLNELKSSTPTTPKDLQSLNVGIEDEEGLDASELEGAMIVDVNEKFGSSSAGAAIIPSDAEIREKKDRRARLAHEKDFISLSDDEGDDRRHISLLPRKKKTETRLVREDEDLGEGFDEFVDDGRISLGKRQEREAKRRQRKEMADMIHQAEGSSDEESDDSEAERRASYEAAQTRAGMDGLVKPNDGAEAAAVQVPSKIIPLPDLSACLERLQTTLSTMEQELERRHKKMADLEQEKRDIVTREGEVQALLKQTGERYAALNADSKGAVVNPQSILDAHNGLVDRIVTDRGLESFGNTPTTRPQVEDLG